MKKIYLGLISLGLFVLANGCSDDFGDTNVPVDAVTDVEPKFFLSSMQQEVFSNYQRNVNLYPDLYSQYWANTVSSFGSPRYEYVDGWIGNQWKEFYTRHLRSALAIDASYADNPVYVDALAIKDIWMCYWWSRLTDTYGDMPYFDAGKGKAVPYTSQEEIYTDLFKRLDKAVTSITGGSEQYKYDGGYDLIYGGDASKWQKFGNSLRLRLAMRISNINPDKAKTEAQAAIKGTGGLLASNSDVVKVPMWSDGWFDYIHQIAWNWDNIRMSKTFSNYLYNQSSKGEDPRAPKWFAYKVLNKKLKKTEAKTKKEAGFSKYEGLENGYNLVPSDAKEKHATINLEGGYEDFAGNLSQPSHKMYCPVMFYSEVKFLVAEAALRGWTSGDVNALYKEGIEASMAYVGVADSDATTYIDGIPNISGSDESKLKQLITQKWISNFPNGVEGWADFRRTDYPDLVLPKDGVSGSSTVTSGTWVKRIRYPDNEHEQNKENIPAALNTTDTDRMDIRLWWDTADTKAKTNGVMNSNF